YLASAPSHRRRVAMEAAMTRLTRLIVLLALVLAGAPALAQAPAGKPAEKPPTAAKTELVDLNSASEAELKELPGIGEAYSKKLVAGRPYANKTQLVSRGIVPQATYDKIADKVIAKQPKK